MIRSAMLLLVSLGLAGGLCAQTPQSNITVKMDSIPNFTGSGWSFGVTLPVQASSTAYASGKAQISTLNLAKDFDSSSLDLFHMSVSGAHTARAVLTQTDPSGKHPPMTVTLEDVVVSNYQIGGSTSAGAPGETIGLSFGKITIEYNGGKTYWDLRSNTVR